MILHHWEMGPKTIHSMISQKVVDGFGWNVVDQLGRCQEAVDLNFGGPDSDPSYRWDTKCKLFNLGEVCTLPSTVQVMSVWDELRAQLSHPRLCSVSSRLLHLFEFFLMLWAWRLCWSLSRNNVYTYPRKAALLNAQSRPSYHVQPVAAGCIILWGCHCVVDAVPLYYQ